ncbi:MAG: HAD hydrolase family protein [Vicinamibacterales bacterium]
MKFSVLALDYDGTIAHHDSLDPNAREAIARARATGVTVLLVTGRILRELQRVTGGLHFVDGIVAENGAVVHFPESRHTTVLAPRVPAAFLAELTRRGLACTAGEALVDADAALGPQLLDVIRAMELPLVLLYNHGRVMVLPQGVSKATGLQVALGMLRLSARNMVAVGDAENDHELLRLAEVGVAVEWGSAALAAAADTVVRGSGPSAVAGFVDALLATRQLPMPSRPRRRLRLGHAEDGSEFSLAVRGRNVLVAGDAKSGKSWVTGLLCEQLILYGYCVCVIDPEGDYRSLEGLPGVTVLGGEEPPPQPAQLTRALRYPDRSVVLDLSHVPQATKIDYIRGVLPALTAMRRQTGLPHRIVVDEAHYFLQEDGEPLLDLDLNGYTLVTYRASRLPEPVLASVDVMIVTCESDPAEIAALKMRCEGCHDREDPAWARLPYLGVGQAVALPITEEAGGALRVFTMGPRLTPHVRHRQKYVDVPVTEAHAFLFAAADRAGRGSRRARTLREFVDALDGLTPAEAAPYLRRGDFSRWIGEVFGDQALADEIRARERRHLEGGDRETVPELVAAVRARYDLTGGRLSEVPPSGAGPSSDTSS